MVQQHAYYGQNFNGDGTQLRPFIVWFGESVPEIETAVDYVEKADSISTILPMPAFIGAETALNVRPDYAISIKKSPCSIPSIVIIISPLWK